MGGVIGGGVEIARQYLAYGSIKEPGRVLAATGAGALSGAIVSAVPAVGLLSAIGVGAGSNTVPFPNWTSPRRENRRLSLRQT